MKAPSGRRKRPDAPGSSEEKKRQEFEAIYRDVVGELPLVPPHHDNDDIHAGVGDILGSPEDSCDRAVVLLRDSYRLFVAPVVASEGEPAPLDLDVPEADQHETLRIACGGGGWITVADAARLDLIASITNQELCEARRRLLLRFSTLEPAPSPAARGPMGTSVSTALGPLGPWVAAQLDADRGISSLAVRWAGTSVGRDLLASARRAACGAVRELELLDGIFDGVASALSHIATAPGASFDDVWVVLEALEETAAVVTSGGPALNERFAARIATMVSRSESPLIQGGLTWSVNELLERGPASAALGLRVARALLTEAPPLVCDLLYMLAALRRSLAESFAAEGLSESLALHAASGRARVAEAAAAVEQLDARIADMGTNPLDAALLLAPLAPFLARIHAGVSDPVEGMLAMAAIKRPLWHLSRAIQQRPEREALIVEICEAFLGPLADRAAGTAFLVVEALEAVRDWFPQETSAIMAETIPHVQLDVAYGLGVCIIEGIEEELGADPARRPPRFVVREDPGAARQCEYEEAHPPSAFGDFGRRTRRAAEANEGVAGVWRWCQRRLHGP